MYKNVLNYLFETFKSLPPIEIIFNENTYLLVDQIVRKVIEFGGFPYLEIRKEIKEEEFGKLF